jgi:ABC-type polysaccharide/polyol phosphate export permease
MPESRPGVSARRPTAFETGRRALALARYQFRLKYRHTLLGVAWNVLEPALFLGVLTFVFAVVNDMKVAEYAVFLFCTLVPWRYFEGTVTGCTESVVGGEWLLRRMPVSPFVFPLARWLLTSLEFAFAYPVALVAIAVLKPGLGLPLLVVPLGLLVWSAAALGLGMLCATAYVFLRDVRTLVQISLMLAFFSSPILVRADLFAPGSAQATLFKWHPVSYFAALFQKPFHYGTFPSALDWTVAGSIAAVLLLAGWQALDAQRGRVYYGL